VALGVAKFVLGPPTVILGGLLTWRLLRRRADDEPAAATS
jgi:hypothetical protein